MQHLTTPLPTKWKLHRLMQSHLNVLLLMLLWFLPVTHPYCQYLDYQLFKAFNQSLLHSTTWQYFWGYLNHSNESWINLIAMIGINLIAVGFLPATKRAKALAMVLYFWFFFQIGLFLSHAIFSDLLQIERESPSLVIKPWVRLSDALNIREIKDYSDNCFPAGHVFVLIFWARFTLLYATKPIKILAICVALLLSLPRLFSGAHWLSDVVFTIGLSSLWLTWAVATPLYANSVNYLEQWLLRLQEKLS